MRVPTADYTTQQNALANKYQAKSGKYLAQQISLNTSNAKVAQNALQISEKSLALSKQSQANSESLALAQQQYYQSMASLNKLSLGVNIAQSVFNSVYSIVQARDESKAKTALLDILNENNEKTTTSIVNQKNKFTINPETGEMQAVIDSELTEWQNSQIEKIKSMGLTKDVEQSAINSLQSAFNDSKSTILSGIANDAAKELQEYNTILENNALQQDTYIMSFDDFINPDIDEYKKYSTGYTLIDGRAYLSDSEKKTAKANYRISSNEQRAQYYVGDAAKSGGKAEAYKRVEQLRDYLNLDDATCTKLLQYADTVESQYVDALSSKASEAMTSALNQGMLPDEIYRTLTAELEGESEEHKSEALQSAINAHITWATADVSSIIAGYTTADEAGLATILSNLSERSAYYAGGAETVFNQAVTQVSKQLSTIASPEAATAIITHADEIKQNQKRLDAICEGWLTNIKIGVSSPYEIVTAIERDSLKFTAEQLEDMAVNDSDAYIEAISAQTSSMNFVKKALEAYKDSPNYSTYSYIVKDAESSLLNIWGLTEKTLATKGTDEQKEAFSNFRAYVSGALIDLMNQTASNELSDEDLLDMYEDIKNLAISKNWSVMTSETVMDSTRKNPTESALQIMQTFVETPGSVYYNDYTGNLIWYDKKMQSTFENAALQLQNDVADQFGLTFKEAPSVTLNEKGTSAYPVAEFNASNGNKYRVNPDGSVYVVGVSGNLMYYGTLGEEPSTNEPVIDGKTATQMIADTVAQYKPEEVLEMLGNIKTEPQTTIPSTTDVTTEIERLKSEGYQPDETELKNRVDKLVESGVSESEATERATTELITQKTLENISPKEQKTKQEYVDLQGLDTEIKRRNMVASGYYGQQATGYQKQGEALKNGQTSEPTPSYVAAFEERVKELIKEGYPAEEAREQAAKELAPQYGGNK